MELPDVQRDHIKIRLQGDSLTISGERRVINPEKRDPLNPDRPAPPVIVTPEGRVQASLAPLFETQTFSSVFSLPQFPSRTVTALHDHADQSLVIHVRRGGPDEIDELLRSWGGRFPEDDLDPVPVEVLPALPHTLDRKTQTHEPSMTASAPDDSIVIQNGTLFRGGHAYRPLSAAATEARTHRTTLLNWIKNKTLFAGKPLESYHFTPANRYYVSEESIQRAANRYIKWWNGKPAGTAGPVIIGKTRDKTGYIGITKAAQTIGVDHHTMWLWTAHGTAPTDKPLEVIKDLASEQFYIREKDIAQLRKLIPRSGLKRGRRPQVPTPEP
jgi:hypothetical protein